LSATKVGERWWNPANDPEKFCVVCNTRMFRHRAQDGRIRPATSEFLRKKFCSMACRTSAFTNTQSIPFGQVDPDGVERWVVDQETGCWLWQTCYMGKGYGGLWTGLKTEAAHRWVYENMVGPIPEGLELDHLYRKRACVNPLHLEPVTHIVNKRRGIRVILTEDDVREIRRLRETGVKYRVLAEQFGVSMGNIHPILTRKIWKDVA